MMLNARLLRLQNDFVDSPAVESLRDSADFNAHEVVLPAAVPSLPVHLMPDWSGVDGGTGGSSAASVVIVLPDDFLALQLMVASYTRQGSGPRPVVLDVVPAARGLVRLFGAVPRLSFTATRTAFRFRASHDGAGPPVGTPGGTPAVDPTTRASQDVQPDFVRVSMSSRLRDLAADMRSRLGAPMAGAKVITDQVFHQVMRSCTNQALLEELQRALTTLASTVLIRLGNTSAPLKPSTVLSEVWKPPQGAQPVESRAQLVLRGYHLSSLPDFLEVRFGWCPGRPCVSEARWEQSPPPYPPPLNNSHAPPRTGCCDP